MATTENLHIGDASKTKFSFTFPYLNQTDVEVYVYATNAWVKKTITTHYTFDNATTIKFGSAPAAADSDEQALLGDTKNIKIKRNTSGDSLAATFYPGSAIRAGDLNDNYTQNLYVTQEASNLVTDANTDAAAALTTATTANTTAAAAETKADTAISTANTASTNATNAVSTANTASTNATNAVTTANNASTTATSAEAAVSSVLPYTIVANKAALLAASVTQDDIYEVTDTTDLEDLGGGSDVIWVNSAGSTSGQDIAALKPNVTWDSGITLKMKKYGTNNSDRKWIFQSYFANDPETKYAPAASPTFTGTPAAPTASASTNTTQIATTAFVVAEIADEVGTTVQAYDADLTALSSCQSGAAAALALLTSTEVAALNGFTGDKDDLIYAKDLKATGVTDTEFDYLDGVTSAIQTQLDAKPDLTDDQSWSGAQRGTIPTPATHSSGATYDFDMNAGNNFKLTIAAAVELGFSNIAAGQSGTIEIVNGAITPTWGSECHFVGGTVIDLTQSVTSYLSYYSPSASVVIVKELLDVKAQS